MNSLVFVCFLDPLFLNFSSYLLCLSEVLLLIRPPTTHLSYSRLVDASRDAGVAAEDGGPGGR